MGLNTSYKPQIRPEFGIFHMWPVPKINSLGLHVDVLEDICLHQNKLLLATKWVVVNDHIRIIDLVSEVVLP